MQSGATETNRRFAGLQPRLIRLGFLVILLAVAILYVATLREGHRWGDDFAAYLTQARNIAEGRNYSETRYIKDPSLGPPNYPPVTALLLAPVYKLSGLRLTPFKLVEIALFLGFLGALFLLSRDYFPGPWSLLLLALVGFNPYYCFAKDDILSDIPFMFFVYAALYFSVRSRPAAAGARSWRHAILMAAAVCLAAGTRSLGAVLALAVLASEISRRRKISRRAIVLIAGIAAPCLALMLWQKDTIAVYAQWFTLNPKWIALNLLTASRALRAYWLTGSFNLLSYPLCCMAAVLAAWGFWTRIRSAGPGAPEWFAVLYLLAVSAFLAPSNSRYLMPFFPIYGLYMVYGLRSLAGMVQPRLRTALVSSVAVIIAAGYVIDYASADLGPIVEGMRDPEFVALCNVIDRETSPQDVIVFRKPRLLSLATNHRSAVASYSHDHSRIWAAIRRNHARYIIVGFVHVAPVPSWRDIGSRDFHDDRTYLWETVQEHRGELMEVYSNQRYKMFKIIS
jgi:hypothetical protein